MLSSFYSKIYIIHHLPYVDRKKYFDKKIEEYGLNVEYVTGFQTIDDINNTGIQYTSSINIASCLCKFLYCFQQQLTNNYENILILEDDVLFKYREFDGEDLTKDAFISYLNKIAIEFNELNGDLAFMGSAANYFVANPTPDRVLYYDNEYTTRGAHAVLFNKRSTEQLVESLKGYIFHTSIDVIIPEFIKSKNLKCLWTYPGLTQGLEIGHYNK